MERKINILEEEMMDQSKRLNHYHKLLTEELNKSNDSMMRETERKLNEYTDLKFTSQIQNLNEFKNNVDNFINVFSKDIQYDLKNLEKKIFTSCKTNFLTKEEFLPKNQKSKEEPKNLWQMELDCLIKENIEKSIKMIYDDLAYIQKNNDGKLEMKQAEIEKIRQNFFRALQENNEEISYLKKTFGNEFKNLNECYLGFF